MTNQTLGFTIRAATLLSLAAGAVSCQESDEGNSSYRPPVDFAPLVQVEFSSGQFGISKSMYSDDAGRLTTLYFLAVSNPDQLPAFVRSNRSVFQNVEQLRQCTLQFNALVVQAIMRAPSRNEVYEGAMNIAGSDPELGALCGGITDGAMNTLADLLLLASHYSDLANSLESILLGNDDLYHQTAIYQLAKILELGTQMFSAEFRVFIFESNFLWMYALTRQACR